MTGRPRGRRGRPRKYRHIQAVDRIRLSPHDNIYCPSALYQTGQHPFPATKTAEWRAQAGWRQRQEARGRLAYPQTNGRNDPLTIMLVLDCLMRLETDSYITANPLTAMLWQEYPQMTWDAVTVGYILSKLAETTEDLPEAGHMPPFAKVIYAGVAQYAIADDGLSRRWMGRARDLVADKAKEAIQLATERQPIPKTDVIFDDIGNLALQETAA